MITLIILGAILLLVIVVIISIYNSLIKATNVVDEAYSGIDVQLKKRFELIPSLIASVKAYNFHESKVLEDVVKERLGRESSFTKTMEDDQSVSRTLKSVRVQVEAYPDLKANTEFIRLMDALSKIENELSMARRYYNGTTRDLNNKLEIFPNVLFAGIMGFKKKEFYSVDDNEKEVPKIDITEN